MDTCINRDRAMRGVLVNRAALHYKYDSPDGCDVFQWIAFDRDDIGLKAGRNRADLIGHA